MRRHSKDFQDSLTPEMALTILKEGNERFVNNLKANRDLLQQVNETSDGQHPFATVLSCMDSRTSAELIFDQGLGDIFSIRIAGNVLNDDILGSMEYATKVVGTKTILVLGHTKCGAITGACDQVKLGHLSGLLHKIQPAIDMETTTVEDRNGKNETFSNNVAKFNVQLTIERVRKESEIIAQMETEGLLTIAGGVYDVDSGVVNFI